MTKPSEEQPQTPQPDARHGFIWQLYPSHTNKSFNKNDPVYIRPKSVKEIGIVGRIVEVNSSPKGETNVQLNHIPILCRNGVVKRIRASRLVPIYDMHQPNNPSVIVLTADTNHYRQLAVAHVRENDKILEVGCSTGGCTALILRRMILSLLESRSTNSTLTPDNFRTSGEIVAFDTGSDMVQQTREALKSENEKHFPHQSDLKDLYASMSEVHKIDAFANPKGALAVASKGGRNPNLVLIDIGGNRELESVTRMINWVQSTFIDHPPRAIIVKSQELAQQFTCNKKIEDAQSWLMGFLKSNNMLNEPCQSRPPNYAHPLQAPLALSPRDNSTPICRFHNYHIDGCKRYNKEVSECPLDHEHCHWCQRAGHVARECSSHSLTS